MKLQGKALFFLLPALLLATAATASEIKFTGDARARYIHKTNYNFGVDDGSSVDHWDSRVRINFSAKTKGGAYAKTRMRFVDQNWGLDKPRKSSDTGWVDIAYLGVPIGPTVLEAGLLKSNLSRFFEYDQSVDQAALAWEMFDSSWTAIFRVGEEGQLSNFDIDRINDNDLVAYGLLAQKKFLDNYTVKAALFYTDDQRDEFVTGDFIRPAEGFYWSLFLDGKIHDLAFATEVAFRASDTRQSRDENGFIINQTSLDKGDGWGWYLQGEHPMGSFVGILNLGIAANGYQADNDFGWLMIGNSNNEPIALIGQVGDEGDWFWIAPSLKYRPTEKLSMTANFVYVDINHDSGKDDKYYFDNLYELSGEITYQISDGASFSWKLGALNISGLYEGNSPPADTAIGTYAKFDVKF